MTNVLGANPAFQKGARHTIANGLATVLNIIALTVCLVVVSLTVVGLPLAWSAAWSALYDWRRGGESRVMGTFWRAVASQPVRRTVIAGPAFALSAIGALEVSYFLHYRGPIAVVCLTTGLLTLAAGLSFAAYLLLLLTVASPEAKGKELWRCAAAIIGRTSFATTPAFLAQAAVAGLIGYTDPGVLVVALPVILLWGWMRTALWGARRAGLGV